MMAFLCGLVVGAVLMLVIVLAVIINGVKHITL